MNSSTGQTGPGKVLQEARENKNISIAEVSDRLKLGAGIVEAIEANDLESLPAPAFVRGYLRSYALLLNLEQSTVIDLYHAIAPADPELSSIHPTKVQKQGMEPIMLWITAAIVLGLLILFILWAGNWYKSYLEKNKALVSNEPERITTPYYYPSLKEKAVEPRSTQLDSITALPLNADPDLEMQTSDSVTDDGLELGEVVPGNEPTTIVETSSLELDFEDTVKSEVEDEIKAIKSTESNLEINPVAPQGGDQLAIRANGESWVYVIDANGYRLMYRMVEEAETVSLSGQAPFDVVLGASPNVVVSINGREFDHSAFTRANLSARFILRSQN